MIQTQIYISEEYPIGSILKVEKIVSKINEVMVGPTWFEEGMKCFGMKAFLEHEDYLVLVESN